MGLFSHPVDTSQKLPIDKPKERRPPLKFRKDQQKRNLSDDLKQDALKLLNEMLAKQKKEIDESHALSASGPFVNQIAFNQISDSIVASLKIDPSAQFSQLFEKLVRTLIHVNKSGISETSIFFDEEFSSSIFNGTKITITEYSTAPKIFNIQLNLTPEALSFYEGHAASLLVALKKGKFGFDVGRIDSGLYQEENEEKLVKAIEQDLEKEDNS